MSAATIPTAELQGALDAALARQKRALDARDFDEFRAANAAVLAAERVLAAAKNEPHAVPVGFPVKWDTGAPLPHLIRSDNRTFLVFLLGESDLADDVALVEFKGCSVAKMGAPNDEVIHGHPLHGKGMEPYCALEVKNSAWIEELKAINSVHRNYRPESWKNSIHYILGFHDCTFECVAESFVVERQTATMQQALADVCSEITKY